jgi:hypothetical protein
MHQKKSVSQISEPEPKKYEAHTSKRLSSIRVIGVLPGYELFGNERDNIEIYLALREQGANVIVGIKQKHSKSDVEKYLIDLGFETFNIPFGNQWSWMWLKQYPFSIFEKLSQLWNCSRILFSKIKSFQPTHIHLGSLLGYNYIAPTLFLSTVPLIYRTGDGPPADSAYSMKIWHLAMNQSTKIVAVSEFIKRQIISQGIKSSKVDLLYNLAPSRIISPNSNLTVTKNRSLVYVDNYQSIKGSGSY